ncbi:CLUMA_CG007417, isoform A [Clunio marinus]|uniref:CLUMA_CG007417, isoform A n=1 Tax=Clunio marinus TaxID=568069 RepID=A0A1J1I298_9DIPT|nr:CLUMA_CG007417, isoform A [Clunio marinus]
MKMLRKFVLCCVFLQFRCSFAAISILKAETSGNLTIPKYISFLVNENNKQDQTHNYDVVLIRLELQHQNDTFENIREELLKVNRDNPILTFDLFDESQPKVQFPQIYAASFIIIVTDLTDSTLLRSTLFDILEKITWQVSIKFVIITPKISPKLLNEFVGALNYFGFINHLILGISETVNAYSSNMLTKRNYWIADEDIETFSMVFPDKLKNFQSYQFPVLFLKEYSRCMIRGRKVDGINFRVMNMILKKYNGTVKFTTILDPADPQAALKVQKYFYGTNNAAFSLSTIMDLKEWKKWIYTHDENGYCALIPKPQRLTFLHFILTPFDGLSWTFMITSIVVCSIFWKLLTRSYNYLRSNSPFFFIFGVIANFLGQSIPFRNSRRIQKLLLQLCVLMTFIMGNAYQSLIIASMSTSRDGRKFNTWQEMFSSNLSYESGEIFYNIIKDSGDYPDVVSLADVLSQMSDRMIFWVCKLHENLFFHLNVVYKVEKRFRMMT